jgi:hypothetical protein
LPYRPIWEWHEDEAERYCIARFAETAEVVGDGATHVETETILKQCLEDCARHYRAAGWEIPQPESTAAGG